MSARNLSLSECRSLLRSKRIGRVVFTDRALPSALPVNYLFTEDGIVFRTDPAGLLARQLDGATDAVLAFEVDEVDEHFESGWSVLVVGMAARLPEDEARRWDGTDLRAWGSDDASSMIRIPIDRLSGRVVESLPGDAAFSGVSGPVATS